MKFVFWLSLLFIFYTYIGYPAILWVWAHIKTRPVNKKYIEPFVSIIISVYNEEKFIAQKLASCLELDYPKDQLEIIIVSDGSDDRTNQIINEYQNRGIRFFSYPERKGKPTALNLGVAEANGEVIFFTDARQMLEKSAIRELVSNFSDPKIGSVSGELMLISEDRNVSSEGMGLYWKVEKWMRDKESQIHSMMGATGAIYAIRRSIFSSIPAETILDDMLIPLRGVLKGYRATFDRSAKAYDISTKDLKEESKRKVRTLGGNFQLLKLEPRFLNPFSNPVFFQFISHKLFRLLIPFAMSLCFLSNLFLLSTFYIIILIGQFVFYLSAVFAPWASDSYLGKIMKAARVVIEMNLAVLKGFYKFARNSQVSAWEKADI